MKDIEKITKEEVVENKRIYLLNQILMSQNILKQQLTLIENLLYQQYYLFLFQD